MIQEQDNQIDSAASQPHHLTVVGLGPGDPDLITLKGLRAIEAADIIFVPRSRDDEPSLALRIAAPWINRERQRIIELTLPMTRDREQQQRARQAAAVQIATSLGAWATTHQQPARGVYLLMGDPLLYGTFTALWDFLVNQPCAVAIEMVPGVTSFAALAAQVGLPLGSGDERIVIAPAPSQSDLPALHRLCTEFETVILMKVGRVLPQVIAALNELGLLDHAIYAEYVGMPQERIVHDVTTLRETQGPYFSLLIVQPGKEQP